MTFPTNSKWLKTLAPAAALALLYVLSALLLRPFVNLPWVDDWTRGWSVEHFLKTGELRVPDWTSHYPFAQILWGALFCLPQGFSFSALRVSTAVLAWLGALAFYASLRELECSRQDSLIGTLLLLVNPVFFILTFSFMTDSPFVSLANIAFFFFVRGIVRQEKMNLWVGSFFGICAFFTRQLALAIPTALLAYLLLTPRHRRLASLLPAALSFFFLLLTPLWIGHVSGSTSAYLEKFNAIRFWFLVSPMVYAADILRIFLHVGLALSPLTLPSFISLHRRSLLWGTTLALLLLEGACYVLAGEVSLPLEKRGMWKLTELGDGHPLLRGVIPPPFLPSWLNYPLTLLSLLSAAVIVVRVAEVIRRQREKSEFLFCLYALFHTGLIIALWFFYDRYYLVLLPPLIALLACNGLPEKRGTVAGVTIFLLLSLSGTWDNLQITKTTHSAFLWLREREIPIAEIDAGYVLNGWNLYVHPENLPLGAIPERDVPFVTSKEKKSYVIAVSPLPGYRVLREILWTPSFWAVTNKIYVLEKVKGEARQ